MEKAVYYLFLLMFVCLLSSCPTPTTATSGDNDGGDASSLPVEESAVYFTDDTGSGETVFSLNEVSAVTSGGSTYWGEVRDENTDFSSLEIIVKKSSGSNVGGFGVIFAQRDTGTDDFSALVVMINILGEFCIGLVEENSFDYICEWASVDNIVTGYSMTNTIRIEEYESSGRYKLYINDLETEDFEDPSETVHDGGGYGYLAVVTPVEKFPSVPVTVYFEED